MFKLNIKYRVFQAYQDLLIKILSLTSVAGTELEKKMKEGDSVSAPMCFVKYQNCTSFAILPILYNLIFIDVGDVATWSCSLCTKQ